jgi:hypothetical protein
MRTTTHDHHVRRPAPPNTTTCEDHIMGTWGFGTFENDTAADWAYTLDEASDLAPMEAALDAVESGRYLDADMAAEALAAGEVLAALRGKAAADLPDEVRAWVAGHPQTVPAALLAAARGAVEKVAQESELRDLWEESDDFAAWQRVVGELRARLG